MSDHENRTRPERPPESARWSARWTGWRVGLPLALAAAVAVAAAACGSDGGGRRAGDPCAEDGDCSSGLCFQSVCLAPDGDEDGDGLLNRVEAQLGTSPTARDTDADEAADGAEVGDPAAPADEDGDGTIDALESLSADADADCRVDQRDAHDDKADDRPELVPDVCPDAGVCAGAPERHVRCTGGGGPECVLTAVPGWEADEQTCDEQDNDCDGATDEAAECDPCGPATPLYGPCEESGGCPDGLCAGTPEGVIVCTTSCPPDCPCGWWCGHGDVDGALVYACLPPPSPLCDPCLGDAECTGWDGAAGRCLDHGAAGRFCGTLCGEEAPCPADYDCGEVLLDDETLSLCLPSDGECECGSGSFGAETTCYAENELGRCEGVRQCGAEGLTDCSAPQPAPEYCNGLDDDCDGTTDDDCT